MAMELLDKSGLAYFWTKIKAYVAGLLSSKADDSDVVHIAGTETITGEKIFSTYPIAKVNNNIAFKIINTGITKGNSNISAWSYIPFVDSSEAESNQKGRLGYIGFNYSRKANTGVLVAYNCTTSTNTNYKRLAVGYDASGDWFTEAPTPAVADNSAKIATTAWVRTATGNTALNAATATVLAAVRKINGVSFDGSADVTLTAVVSSASRASDIAADGTFTVPSYIVGADALLVYLDGCLSRQGDGWDEVGTSGQASTTIKFNQIIPASMEIVVRVN